MHPDKTSGNKLLCIRIGIKFHMEKRYQVFVSSTYADLKEERQHVLQALMEMDCIPAGMELFPAADEEQKTK